MPGLHLSYEVLPPPRARLWPRLLRALARTGARFDSAPARAPIHALGQKGEDLAYWSLRQHGYTIVARNFRPPSGDGEVDLIAFQGQPAVLVFIEVKTRSREGNFPAEEAVDAEKRHHLIRAARAYRRRHGCPGAYRFDVVAIYEPDSPRPRILLHRDAFTDHDGEILNA